MLNLKSDVRGSRSDWWPLVAVCVVLLFCSASQAHSAVTLAAVGDVFFARGVGRQIAKHGADWLFEGVRLELTRADLAFCNLECALSKRGVVQRRRFQFRSDPKLTMILGSNGFDVISLANNHTLDYGRDAMLDTVNAVRAAGMTPLGAGRDRKDALALRVVTRNGLQVGFLAYTDLPSCGVVRLDDRPTVAGLEFDELPQQIKHARARCDVLVVSIHWGVEYMKTPTERQRAIARACIDSGADLVLGHHPHVLQTVEIYKGKPIVYSLGAFVWDAKIFGADRSAIYTFRLDKRSARLVKTTPVHIANCRPDSFLGRKR